MNFLFTTQTLKRCFCFYIFFFLIFTVALKEAKIQAQTEAEEEYEELTATFNTMKTSLELEITTLKQNYAEQEKLALENQAGQVSMSQEESDAQEKGKMKIFFQVLRILKPKQCVYILTLFLKLVSIFYHTYITFCIICIFVLFKI